MKSTVKAQSAKNKSSNSTTTTTADPIGWVKKPDQHPLIKEITVAKGTRGFKVPADGARVEKLVQSIGSNQLMNQIILARVRDTDKFEVVAGAGRLAALKQIRPDGRLESSEYRVVSLYSDDPRVPAYSLSENADRANPSPYENMRLVQHLVDDLKREQKDLAEIFHVQPCVISDLMKTARIFSKLPTGWQEDLRKTSEDNPSITFGHVRAALSHFDRDGKASAKTKALLKSAADDGWPVARLRDELNALKKAGDKAITATEGVETPTAPVVPATAPPAPAANAPAERAPTTPREKLEAWRKALSDLATEMQSQYPSLKNKIQDAVKAIETQISQLDADEAGE